MSAEDQVPVLPHMAGEFYAWLWWKSEDNGGHFDLGDPIGRVDVWVDDRLAFRNPNDSKVAAVMTGEHPSTSLEAKAALAGGKVLQELRIAVKRDDREFSVTLKGPAIDLARVKLPQMVDGGGEEALYDRMFLYDELCGVLTGLLSSYARERTGPTWEDETLPAIRRWIGGLDE